VHLTLKLNFFVQNKNKSKLQYSVLW